MASVKDDRGYNQGFAPAKSTVVRMQRRADLIMSEMNVVSNTGVLEIGCGTGEISYWIAQKTSAQIVGTDLCIPFIENAKETYKLPNLKYEFADFNDPHSFAEKQFDYIVGNGILHHLYHNLDDVFANMLRILRDDGKIIFMEPNIYNPYVYSIFSYNKLRALANLEPDEMAFSKHFIVGALERAGFTDINVEYKDFLLPGIPDFLIAPSVLVGSILEKIPVIKKISQSIFITASKPTR